MSRLTVAAATALSTLVVASPALAISPTIAPTPQSTTVPGTSRVVDAWKLVGNGNGASAVQVAPRWVLASGHATLGVGSTFKNSYGSAVVQTVSVPSCARDCNWGTPQAGTDLSLHLLATPIAAPAFPKLLGDTVSYDLAQSLPGATLNVGFGGTDGALPSVGWSASTTGEAVPGATEAPYGIGGDSGGGSFWYPTATGEPVLSSIIISGATFGIQSQQNLAAQNAGDGLTARTWIERELAKAPSATPPQFTTVAAAAGPLSALRPAPVSNARLATGGASTVKIAWDNPAATAVPRTGANIYLNGVLKTSVAASATSVKLTGLSWLTNYTVRVVSTNANGEAAPSTYEWDTVRFKTRWLF